MIGLAIRTAATILMAADPAAGIDMGPGVEVGWRSLPKGGVQYIIQIEPRMLDLLRAGYAIESDTHEAVKDIRSYQVRVGTGKVARSNAPSDDPLSKTVANPPTPAKPNRFTPAESDPTVRPRWNLPGGRSVASTDSPPSALPPNPESRPVQSKHDSEEKSSDRAKQTTFVREQVAARPSLPSAPDPAEAKGNHPEPSKTWMPLTLAMAGLFGSLGGNLYLGWLFWETRRRYRGLLIRRQRSETADGVDGSGSEMEPMQ